MANIYEVTVCGSCKEPVVTSETGTMAVRGWQNLDKAMELLKQGKTLDEVAEHFCSYCLGEMPCKCDNPTIQTVSRFV